MGKNAFLGKEDENNALIPSNVCSRHLETLERDFLLGKVASWKGFEGIESGDC